MGLFDMFKKKAAAPRPQDPKTPASSVADEFLDDITFIRDMKHIPGMPWHQFDILLASQPYGWAFMVDSADYLATSDLKKIGEVLTGDMYGGHNNITDQFLKNDSKASGLAEVGTERGMLSIAGISGTLTAPTKVVFLNQTRVLRIFSWIGDELLIRKYAETIVRRNFGTDDAMKLGRPIPEGK